MNTMNRAKVSAAVAAAALLVGAGASAASATPHHAPAHRGKPSASHEQQRQQRIPFTAANVTANDDGSYTLTWTAPGVRSVAVKANGKVVAKGGSHATVTVKHLPAADRQWFDFVPSKGGSLHLADREIALQGAVNFRDAGGYRTSTGQWVKMGEVYRSGALNTLTTADVAKLNRLGIKVDFDLRTAGERTSAPDTVPAGAKYVVADVIGGDVTSAIDLSSAEKSAQYMVDGEKSMVSSATGKAAYQLVFAGLADDDQHAVLFHCSAGKDRTGWANAALLTALGVPKATVMQDYLASNTYRAEANAAALAAMPAEMAAAYKPMLDVRAEYLNSGFDEVEATFGSFENYEKKGLGLSSKEIKELKSSLLVG
ncbi:tyrosine-protein phosphatase [Streptomyces sp. NBC_00102]|uniref:tyrosine-protein phosphatase n=1 Tax=Streptomyces sp. NBC_00102 TaxID=2975652 RepID=UPI00224E37B0|nr:tyrosine-protein phosphatase [Streptomyces sp. NBC_00102]MCX5397650.1 tyrosine-protein phosphatase [Streptomyces sp. NBC_00102]